MTAKYVTSHMQVIFSEYGWPDILVSDNGPCYNATELKQVMEDMGIHNIKAHHITIHPIDGQKNMFNWQKACCLKRDRWKYPFCPDVIQELSIGNDFQSPI